LRTLLRPHEQASHEAIITCNVRPKATQHGLWRRRRKQEGCGTGKERIGDSAGKNGWVSWLLALSGAAGSRIDKS